MTILDTGLYSIRDLRLIESHLAKRAMLQSIDLVTTQAQINVVRSAIKRRTSFPRPDFATKVQAARLAQFTLMPAPVTNPIGFNVERGMCG